MQPLIDRADHWEWLSAERDRLLDFGQNIVAPGGGAYYLDETGQPDPSKGIQTYLTCRAVHVYSLGAMLGTPGAREIAKGAMAGLTGQLHDDEHGGWFPGVDLAGQPLEDAAKQCYQHAFVVLAASTATAAGLSGARELLDRAVEVLIDKFWDEEDAMCVDQWDRTWSTLDSYRGVNGNMHAVEALLAAADVLDSHEIRERAHMITRNVISFSATNEWRIPEHFTADWEPDLELNREHPDDPFKPFGATVGHGFEWARLILHLEASLTDDLIESLFESATGLFARAMIDGWAVDGADGFVYTTDWEGAPVVHDRMHWVAAEAIAAAAALYKRTGRKAYVEWYEQWWAYVITHLMDRGNGSWHHQLDRNNVVTNTVWPGKPDLYHAYQAALIPALPLAPALSMGVKSGLLAAAEDGLATE
ncbi:AGE family epimerase/isomerase [Ornithinimicrobium sp. Arc0846-15]|nr:AGE family epimerase/isomerase [Ornithinimicrobium laminariae]